MGFARRYSGQSLGVFGGIACVSPVFIDRDVLRFALHVLRCNCAGHDSTALSWHQFVVAHTSTRALRVVTQSPSIDSCPQVYMSAQLQL